MFRAGWGEVMGSDVSVRNSTQAAQRAADALLRSLGGASVMLRLPSLPCGADNDQVGLGSGSYEDLTLSPAVFRRVRPKMQESTECEWELLLSASSVDARVSAAQLDSADTLFAEGVAVIVGTKTFLIEAISASEVFGRAYLYRLLLREVLPKSQ
jgi:hypothetical protein